MKASNNRLLPCSGGIAALLSWRFPAVRAALLVAAFAVLSIAASPPVAAQSADIQALVDRIERLQREVTTLQRQVYKGAPPPATRGRGSVPASGFSAGGGEPRMVASMQVRLDEMEAQLRDFTGRMEELRHGIDQVRKQVEKLSSDIDFRLKKLEQGAASGAGGIAQGATPGAEPAGQIAAGQIAAGQIAAGGTPSLTPAPAQPGVLGTIPLRDLQRQKATSGRPNAQPPRARAAAPRPVPVRPKATPEAQYKHATGLLFQANYGAAERAFEAFLGAYPKHKLAGNAQYWLGESHYARCHPRDNPNQCAAAARAFADGYQKYPNSAKGPDNLLKLGYALAAINKKKSACATYARLLKEYPKAPRLVKSKAQGERRKLHCR